MSLDLHVHTKVDVGVFLPAGHGCVLHRVHVYAVQICTTTECAFGSGHFDTRGDALLTDT